MTGGGAEEKLKGLLQHSLQIIYAGIVRGARGRAVVYGPAGGGEGYKVQFAMNSDIAASVTPPPALRPLPALRALANPLIVRLIKVLCVEIFLDFSLSTLHSLSPLTGEQK